MDFEALVRTRQSVRRYADKPVDRETLGHLIESVRLAPSACNAQPWKAIVVDDPDLKRHVAEATFGPAGSLNTFAPQAPVIVALVMERTKILPKVAGWLKNKDFSLIDIGIAAEHFCLQAAELGLGTCMLGWFDEPKVRKLLAIPRSRRVALLITVGHPQKDQKIRDKIRKSVEDMSSFNTY